MIKILVIEDDIILSAGLCFELDSAGYLSSAAYTVNKAEQLLANDRFELAILDVNLPDGNGFDLCRKIKEKVPSMSTVFLTGNDLEEDVLHGFDMGAEDYVTKPFNTKVLLKKLDVILRRKNQETSTMDKTPGEVYQDGFLTINFSNLTTLRCNEKLNITPNEYKMLRLLINHAGTIVTRKILLERLYDCDQNFIDDHTLTVNVTRLRSKLEDETHQYIKTIRGMGYIWMGQKI